MPEKTTSTEKAVVRCAIYTRKSTEEGLDQEFNSLDAQRESGEAYVASLRHEGWVALPTRYDDGGYTGGNIERPALQQLMKDIAAGKVDAVVIYKRAPATKAGSVVSANRRQPFQPSSGFADRNSSNPLKRSIETTTTAKIAPSWMKISNGAAFGPLNPSQCPTSTICPVDETGMNSVSPSTIPRMTAALQSVISMSG